MGQLIEVHTKDGIILQGVPADTPKEVIQARIDAERAKLTQSPGMKATEAVAGTAASLYKDLPGIADQAGRGMLAIPGLAGDAFAGTSNFIADKFNAGKPFQMMPSDALNDLITGASELVTGGAYERPAAPESGLGKAVGNVAEATVGGASTPGKLAISTAAKLAAVAGLTGEVASRVDPKNPLWRLLGGLAGGGIASVAHSITPNRANVARELLSDVEPNRLADAIKTQERMHAAGTPINISQAMDMPTNLDAGVELMANTKEGKVITDQLRSQPNQMGINLGMFESKLPGAVDARQVVSNDVQEAATNVIKNLKKTRSSLSNRHYADVGVVPESVAKGLVAKLDNYLKTPGLMDDTKKSLTDLRGRLAEEVATPASTMLGANGLPLMPAGTKTKYLTNALDIKSAIKNTVGERASWVLNPKDPETMGQVKYATGMLFDELGQKVAPLARANKSYRDFTMSRIDPVKKSIIGKLAQPRGAMSDVNATENSIFTLFDKGTHPNAKTSSIRTAAEKLNRQDPEVFKNAGRTWFAEKIDMVQGSRTGDRPPEGIAHDLLEVFGNPNPNHAGASSSKWQTTTDILSGMGLDHKQIRGFRSIMNVAAKTAVRPGRIGGLSASGVNEVSWNTMLRRIGNVTLMTPFRQPALFVARIMHSNVLKDVDSWLSTPEGAKMLRELGTSTPGSPKWQKAFITMTSSAVSAGNTDQINNQ